MTNWLPTRDSALWWVGIIGAVVVGLPSHFDAFPWIPPAWQHGIEFAAWAVGIISGKMATSPQPASMGEDDGRGFDPS